MDLWRALLWPCYGPVMALLKQMLGLPLAGVAASILRELC